MPRFNVKDDDGNWACFSTIVDDFITDFMPREEYQAWRIKEYGIHCEEIEQAYLMEFDEAVRRLYCSKVHCGCDECKYWDDKEKQCNILEHIDEINLDED